MALTKDKKKEILGELKDAVKGAISIAFVNFHNLTVEDSTQLRSQLREEGVSYRVAKKTLIKKALDDQKIEGDMPLLEGELALAYGNDLIAPARSVYAFQKDHKDMISIVGGVFEGKYMDMTAMNEIAMIPPTPILRGQFVNVINSPIQGLVVALNQIAEKKES
ncbi:50S ribosomal protein L10 [Candidatus Wolfebacteria bacterium]|nr:MAG: 50S ribosomal protein L10 [Candidatus Wolfebacteria bacterium]